MPPNHFESEVESFLEGSHGDRTHIKRADHHTVTPLCGTLLDPTGTILGEYRRILASPRDYGHSDQFAVFNMSDIWNALPSHRLDPKYHLFKPNESESVPTGWVSKLERELMKRWEHVYTRNKLWICTSR